MTHQVSAAIQTFIIAMLVFIAMFGVGAYISKGSTTVPCKDDGANVTIAPRPTIYPADATLHPETIEYWVDYEEDIP